MKKTKKLILSIITTVASVALMSVSVSAETIGKNDVINFQSKPIKTVVNADSFKLSNVEAIKKKSNLLKPKASFVKTNGFEKQVVGLTVLVDFPNEHNTISYEQIDDFLNKTGYSGYMNNGSVHDFFYNISGKKLDYKNKIVKGDYSSNLYYRTKENKEAYDDVNSNYGVGSRKLVNEVLDWVEDNKDKIDVSDVTRTPESNWKNFAVVNILYAGKSQKANAGLWPHNFFLTRNGYDQVYTVSSIEDELSLGTICHENSHSLLGYPDIYNYNTSNYSQNDASLMAGYYGLMGYGVYNGGSKNPAPPNPYFRNVLSGFETNKIKDLKDYPDGTVLKLRSDYDGNGNFYKWVNPSNERECFILENIQQKRRYEGVPDTGIIIWHILDNSDFDSSETQVTRNIDVSIAYAGNPEYYYLGLPFKEDTVNKINSFNTPSIKWYSGEYSGLAISNISKSKDVMTFRKGY